MIVKELKKITECEVDIYHQVICKKIKHPLPSITYTLDGKDYFIPASVLYVQSLIWDDWLDVEIYYLSDWDDWLLGLTFIE